jgi:hypothetical protein
LNALRIEVVGDNRKWIAWCNAMVIFAVIRACVSEAAARERAMETPDRVQATLRHSFVGSGANSHAMK